MSDALVWEIIKTSSSKTVCTPTPRTFRSFEKGSLRNQHAMKDSGLCNGTAVDVSVNDVGIPVLSLKNRRTDAKRNPDKMWRKITLRGGVRKALDRTEKLVNSYAPSKKHDAMRKVSVIYQANAREMKASDLKG